MCSAGNTESWQEMCIRRVHCEGLPFYCRSFRKLIFQAVASIGRKGLCLPTAIVILPCSQKIAGTGLVATMQ
eukprot:scaffold26885_cov22-Prasinocladus_malaysianus.AAC.1